MNQENFLDQPEDLFPTRVVIEFLEGLTDEAEAITFVRGFIENNFDALSQSSWCIRKYTGGYVFEAQEGGPGQAYLPEVMELLERDYDATVCIKLERRVLEIKRNYSGEYSSILLPEGMKPPEDNLFYARPGPRLIPYRTLGTSIFWSGFACITVALVVVLVTFILFIGNLVFAGKFGFKDETASLPLTQWFAMQKGTNEETYIRMLKFEEGEWVIRKGKRKITRPKREEPSPKPEELLPECADGLSDALRNCRSYECRFSSSLGLWSKHQVVGRKEDGTCQFRVEQKGSGEYRCHYVEGFALKIADFYKDNKDSLSSKMIGESIKNGQCTLGSFSKGFE